MQLLYKVGDKYLSVQTFHPSRLEWTVRLIYGMLIYVGKVSKRSSAGHLLTVIIV